MNKVLRSLMLSDLCILGSFGLIQPLFALFVLNSIGGATITTIGIATAIQLVTKAFFQLIVAYWADCTDGNCRELYTLIAGSIIISLIPLGYIVASTVMQIYLIQFFYGLGQALSYPSWRAIFSSYLDHGKAAYEWGIYDTVVSLAIATTAAVGSFFVEKFSFAPIFLLISVLSAIGTIFLTTIFKQEFRCRIRLSTIKKSLAHLGAETTFTK